MEFTIPKTSARDTNLGLDIDVNGCALYQLDSDGDGVSMNRMSALTLPRGMQSN